MSRNESHTSNSSHNEEDLYRSDNRDDENGSDSRNGADRPDSYDDANGSDSHDGAVAQIEPSDDGNSAQDHSDSNGSHSVDGANTVPGTPVVSPAIPAPTAITPTVQGPYKLYDFGIVNGQVTQVLKTEHGVMKNERIDANEAYTVQGTEVIKTETKAYGQEVTRYVDPDGDGLYAKFSEQWLPSTPVAGGAAPVTTQPLYDRGGDSDDHLAVRAGQDPALGGQGADTFVVREWGHVTIGDFHHNQHDRLVFDMGQGVNSVQELAQRLTDLRWQGDDLVLEMGDQASVTVVGARINGIGLEDLDVLS